MKQQVLYVLREARGVSAEWRKLLFESRSGSAFATLICAEVPLASNDDGFLCFNSR